MEHVLLVCITVSIYPEKKLRISKHDPTKEANPCGKDVDFLISAFTVTKDVIGKYTSFTIDGDDGKFIGPDFTVLHTDIKTIATKGTTKATKPAKTSTKAATKAAEFDANNQDCHPDPKPTKCTKRKIKDGSDNDTKSTRINQVGKRLRYNRTYQVCKKSDNSLMTSLITSS